MGGRPHSQKVTHKSHRGSCSPEDTVRCPPFLSHPQALTSPAEPQLQHIIAWGPYSEHCSTPTFTSGELEGAPALGEEEDLRSVARPTSRSCVRLRVRVQPALTREGPSEAEPITLISQMVKLGLRLSVFFQVYEHS